MTTFKTDGPEPIYIQPIARGSHGWVSDQLKWRKNIHDHRMEVESLHSIIINHMYINNNTDDDGKHKQIPL